MLGQSFRLSVAKLLSTKGVPTIVWTSLIGHAFLDAYEHFRKTRYLKVAASACEHILRDLERIPKASVCISYIPENKRVHNANTLGASLLARPIHTPGTRPTGHWRRRRSIHCQAPEGRRILVLR